MHSDGKYIVIDFTIDIYVVIDQTDSCFKSVCLHCWVYLFLLISINTCHQGLMKHDPNGVEQVTVWIKNTVINSASSLPSIRVFSTGSYTVYLILRKVLSPDVNHIWWPAPAVYQAYPNLSECLHLNCKSAVSTDFTFNWKDQPGWCIPLENGD